VDGRATSCTCLRTANAHCTVRSALQDSRLVRITGLRLARRERADRSGLHGRASGAACVWTRACGQLDCGLGPLLQCDFAGACAGTSQCLLELRTRTLQGTEAGAWRCSMPGNTTWSGLLRLPVRAGSAGRWQQHAGTLGDPSRPRRVRRPGRWAHKAPGVRAPTACCTRRALRGCAPLYTSACMVSESRLGAKRPRCALTSCARGAAAARQPAGAARRQRLRADSIP
jgi:hypothetical protein